MKKDDELRRKLAEVFEHYEAEPEPQTWEHIREAIRPERKRRLLWLWWSACLGLLVGVGFFYHSTLPTNDLAVKQPGSTQSSGLSQAVGLSENEQARPDETTPPPVQMDRRSNTRAAISGAGNGRFAVHSPSVKTASDLPTAYQHTTAPPQMYQPQGFNHEPFQADSVNDSARIPDKALLAEQMMNQQQDQREGEGQDTGSVKEIPRLSLRAVALLDTTKWQFRERIILKKPHQRIKGAFTAEITVLSAYQLMQYQAHDGNGITNIRLLPALDARRLGTSWSAGYRLRLRRRIDMNVGLTWMNLPRRAVYAVTNPRQVQVEIQSPTAYRSTPVIQKEVSDVSRQNWWGIQLDYGYTCTFFGQNIRVFAGAEGLWSGSADQAECWAQAGFEIPIAHGGYRLAPVFKYQFQQVEQSDYLRSMRFYTLGLGLKKSF